jgi:hypothetical protein
MLTDVVVRKIVMIDEDHDEVGTLELRWVAGHALERRDEVGVVGDQGIVHSHVGAKVQE